MKEDVRFEDFEYSGDNESSSAMGGGSQNQLFDESFMMFKGSTVGNFFDFLRTKQNLFIDIDYEKKIVKIYKYKQEFIQLTTGNIQIKGTLTNQSSFVSFFFSGFKNETFFRQKKVCLKPVYPFSQKK